MLQAGSLEEFAIHPARELHSAYRACGARQEIYRPESPWDTVRKRPLASPDPRSFGSLVSAPSPFCIDQRYVASRTFGACHSPFKICLLLPATERTTMASYKL